MNCPVCGHENLPGSDQCDECLADLRHEDVPRPRTEVQRSIMEDPISVLGLRVPIAIPEESVLGEAIRIMREKNIGAMLAVDPQGRMSGIFSERDLICRVLGQEIDLESTTLASVMTPSPECRKSTDSIGYAIHSMHIGNYRHIPIVDADRKPVGIVALSDIVTFIELHFREIVTKRFLRIKN